MSDNVTNLPRCQATKSDGTPCERIVGAGQRYCYSHDASRAKERSANASKAAKSKVSAEITEVKAELRQLARDVLSKRVTPGVGSVVGQVLGTWLKATEAEARLRETAVREGELELKIREQQELVARIEELEETLMNRSASGYGA